MRKYKPGVCNIGPRNRISRLSFGVFFLIAGIWGNAFIEVNGYAYGFKLLLFVLFYLGFLGLVQAISGFCVKHARRHTYDLT